MAAFTIAATLVLVFTLRSANKTNAAAVKAASAALEANQIMRDEQRPWLQFEVEDFRLTYAQRSDGKIMPFFKPVLMIENHGGRPAFAVTVDIEVLVTSPWSVTAIDDLIAKRKAERRIVSAEVIFPKSSEMFDRFGIATSDLFLNISGDDLEVSSVAILLLLFYVDGEDFRYTAKFYQCPLVDFLPRPRTDRFNPGQLAHLNRYT